MKQIFILVAFTAFTATSYGQNTYPWPASGRVGIGTNIPDAQLEIKLAGGQLKLSGGTVAAGLFTNSNDLLYLTDWNNSTKGLILNMTSGNLGLGAAPSSSYKLDVFAPAFGFKARFAGPDGYILMGPLNSGWAHIYTDRPNFIFNASIYTMGAFSTYGTDLSLQTAGVDRVTVLSTNGNVGIGTTSPSAKLQVHGGGPGSKVLSIIENPISSGGAHFVSEGANNMKFQLQRTDTEGLVNTELSTAGNSFINAVTGNVGIGTTSPDAKLSVKGTIHTQEIKIDLLGAMVPDYVFEKSYSLPSLEEVKSYIDQNKHLPEVPSAKEMESNGVNLGEMNMLLLKKIEELTLYVIEQNKKLLQQQNNLQQQSEKITALEKAIKN
jgi:hypothetical protein